MKFPAALRDDLYAGRDWKKIILEIKAGYLAEHGIELTNYKIAQFVTEARHRPVHHETIDAIEAGSEPKHSIAVALIVWRDSYSAEIRIA